MNPLPTIPNRGVSLGILVAPPALATLISVCLSTLLGDAGVGVESVGFDDGAIGAVGGVAGSEACALAKSR